MGWLDLRSMIVFKDWLLWKELGKRVEIVKMVKWWQVGGVVDVLYRMALVSFQSPNIPEVM